MKVEIYSFFSGVGILDLGFSDIGFDIVSVNEINKKFLDAYIFSRKNHLIDLVPKYGYNNINIRNYLDDNEWNHLCPEYKNTAQTLFVILGNGFSIDFLNHFSSIDDSIKGKIDVCNLFRLGDSINPPWTNSPGFLSFKITPELWKLGARTTISTKESAALIEEIITCANMYFDFICKPKQQEKRLKMQEDEHLYLKAYSELLSYLRHLFIYYNELVSQKSLENFVQSDSSWGWLKFFKKIHMEKKFERIVFVTYNYDIWLERLLTIFDIPYSIYGFDNPQDSIVEIIKPHGSISFVPQEESLSNYGINYSLNFEDLPLEDFKIQFENLDSASVAN